MAQSSSKPFGERRAADKWDVAAFLALGYTLGFVMTIICMVFFEIPAGNKDLMNTMMGIMGTIQVGIVSFYYGYSKGAQSAAAASDARKAQTDQAVQEIAKASAPVAAAAAAAATAGAPVTIAVTAPANGSAVLDKVDTVNVEAENAVVTEKGKA